MYYLVRLYESCLKKLQYNRLTLKGHYKIDFEIYLFTVWKKIPITHYLSSGMSLYFEVIKQVIMSLHKILN